MGRTSANHPRILGSASGDRLPCGGTLDGMHEPNQPPQTMTLLNASRLMIVLMTACAFLSPVRAQSNDPVALVDRSIQAMGGEARLTGLRTLTWSGMQHQFALEQSERPEGPWLTTYVDVEEIRDLTRMRARRKTKTRSLLGGAWTPFSLVHDEGVTAFEMNGQMRPYPDNLTGPWLDNLRLAPERVLLSAKAAADLSFDGLTRLQGVDHYRVSFTLDGEPVRLFLNAHTSLPTAVETEHAAYFDIWGDVPHRTFYSFWFLEDNGLRYPRQWDTEIDGVPYQSMTLSTLSFNDPVPADTFQVGDDIREMADQMATMMAQRSNTLGIPSRPANEIAPDVIEIPGSWDVVIVRQDDGLVILEAPISSAYSALVMEEAERRFPGMPVKAVVTTSDAWPHLGGVREYVARGIPVFAHALNRPILERLIAADYRSGPDALQRRRIPASITWIDNQVTLGTGPNRMDIHPLRGEGSERMLMVHFPDHNLLYASDMLQRLRDGSWFMPQYLSEVVDAVRREGLSPERAFAMHLGATPWSDILEAVRTLRPE